MKLYMDIFKIDEVKKFVELKNETNMMNAAKFVADDEKVKSVVSDSIKELESKMKEVYFKQLTEQNLEMLLVVVEFLKSLPEEEREEFVKNNLNVNQEVYLKIIAEF